MTPREAQDGAGGAQGGSAVHGEGSGAPAGSQGVTEAEARTAEGLVAFYRGLREGGETDPAETGELAAAIARALAEERAKARAPFLRLASEFGSWPSARILSPHDAGDRIRQAARETE